MKLHKQLRRALAAGMAVAIFLACAAWADVGSENLGTTNRIINNATTTASLGRVVKVDNHNEVGVMVKFEGTQAGTGAITLTFARSPDNTNWETTPRFTWATALNGTTPVVAYTNLTALVGAAGYLKIVSVQNADASASATNFSVTVVKKRLRP